MKTITFRPFEKKDTTFATAVKEHLERNGSTIKWLAEKTDIQYNRVRQVIKGISEFTEAEKDTVRGVLQGSSAIPFEH